MIVEVEFGKATKMMSKMVEDITVKNKKTETVEGAAPTII